MRWFAVIVLAGCGRVDFDPRGDARAFDSVPAPFTCGRSAVADPITLTGATFRYTTFDNQIARIDTVNVRATNLIDLSNQNTTSDTSGNYALPIPTGGAAVPLSLTYARNTFMSTTVFFDEPFAQDVTGGVQALWSPGDGPLWSTSAMDSIYSTISMPRDMTKSTLNVAVRDCAGDPIEGVTVTLDPPPALGVYQAPDGTPSMTETATTAPFTHLIAFNIDAVKVHVTASAPGLRFTEVDAFVAAGVNAMAIVHGGP